MKLHELTKVTAIQKKRLGRGLGSGKGKTGGRGTKGQKARGKISLGFIGGTLPLYKRLPYLRGFGNKKRSVRNKVLSLSKLSEFKAGSEVDLQSLVTAGIISNRDISKFNVKIVGNGEIDKALIVKIPTSGTAAKKIEKAGGKVVNV